MTTKLKDTDQRLRWEDRTEAQKIHLLHCNTKTLKTQQAALAKASVKHSNRLDNLEHEKVTRFLEEAKEDIITVHSAYKLLILKQTVATELCWVSRVTNPTFDLMKTVVRAFDQPDEWWMKHREDTLAQWMINLEKLAEKLAIEQRSRQG